MAARDECGIAGEAEVRAHRERVVGEAVPRVVGVGGGAVAVPAEVERPDVIPRRNEPPGDGLPHTTVKARGVREQHGRAGATPVVHDETDAVRVEVVRGR